jgi:hypothetical protein
MNLIRYYSDFHSYFYTNRNRIFRILSGLKNENGDMMLDAEQNPRHTNYSVDSNNNFTDFYFFYIQNFDPIKKRSNFSFYNNNMIIPRNLDILTGINFSNYDEGTEFKIFLEIGKMKKKISRIILTKKNKNDIFLPINNVDFFPYFLVNDNVKISIYSNKKMDRKINLIYLKIHRNILHQFKSFGSFLINIKDNSFINIQDYNAEIKYIKKKNLVSNEFVFFYNIERFYGNKIFKFIKRIILRKFLIEFLDDEYDVYKDVTNIILKYC